ncbi:MAG: histidinol-phosphate transaminase [Beijerinckiaceae bacterium]|jgi:histidinol-phosphate aminotransferase
MSEFWSEVVHKLSPYVPGEQPRAGVFVKLNTNENPYGPSAATLEAIRAAATERLRLYPDPESLALRGAIAQRLGVSAGEVFVGNGSDEVLAHAFHALLKHGEPLLFPDITYSFYPTYCRLYEIAHRTVPLDAELRLRVEDYTGPRGAIVIANPNAPTGVALPLDDVRRLVAANADRVVLVDEAYVDFGAQSAVSLVRDHANLLVVRTFSKSHSLAGMRVGFAIGQPHLIEALVRVKDSFNSYPLNMLSQAAALAAWRDEAWTRACLDKIVASRAQLTAELAAMGFDVLPSQANFVFARLPGRGGAELQALLREEGVLVRHFSAPRIADRLRITIGTAEECAALTGALKRRL